MAEDEEVHEPDPRQIPITDEPEEHEDGGESPEAEESESAEEPA